MREEERKEKTGTIWVLRSSARPQADGELKNSENHIWPTSFVTFENL